MMICSIFLNRADFATKFTLRPLLKNNERDDSKLTKVRYNEQGLQYLIWCENYLSHSYMAESGSERLLLIPNKEGQAHGQHQQQPSTRKNWRTQTMMTTIKMIVIWMCTLGVKWLIMHDILWTHHLNIGGGAIRLGEARASPDLED
jgi:hypothetical protein